MSTVLVVMTDGYAEYIVETRPNSPSLYISEVCLFAEKSISLQFDTNTKLCIVWRRETHFLVESYCSPVL